jgi:hypothetical protein
VRIPGWSRAGVAIVGVAAATGVTLPAGSAAQMPIVTQLSTMQNPPGIAWFTVETPHFRVIYPDSLAGEAQRVASLLERTYEPLGRSLRARPERLTVVLNNQSMTTNAYVAWSPRRSQWYAMPSLTTDALGPGEWYRLLAVHEGRHVAQERATRRGWIGLASRIFGENTTAALAGSLYFPAWFWEGDAVGLETALTPFGRGRQPSFTGRMRGLRAAGESYEYYPAWQGSYRTLYPDWYELGYVLTSYVRRHHGDSAWAKVIARAAWNPLPPFALSAALHHVTGKSLTELHRAAVAEIDALWTQQRGAVIETPATRLSPPDEAYHVWSQPQYAADGSIIAAYTDLETVTQLVRLREGRREVLLHRAGIIGDLQFHVRGDRVVWSEYEVDPRYGERSYLVIRRLDLTTGKVTRLTDRSRLFAPSLSPDGRTIVAVELSEARRTSLVLLDAETGKESGRLSTDGMQTLLSPAWAPDGRSVYAVHVDSVRGNALFRFPFGGGSPSRIIDYTADAIARPTPAGAHVLFGSPRSGLDNIWGVDTATRVLYRVSSRKFGAYQPAVSSSGDRLLFSDYSARGFEIAEMAMDSSNWLVDSSVPRQMVLFADSVVAQEAALSERAAASSPGVRADRSEWPVRAYRGWSRLVDFHSLTLAPTSDGLNAGLMLESRNMLNTLGLSIGGVVNVDEGTGAIEAGASYAGLPMIVDGAARLGSRVSTYTDTAGAEHAFSWKEQSLTLAARLPLTRLFGQQRQSLTASAAIGLTEIRDQPVEFLFENNNGRFAPVSYRLSASHVRAAAYRDLLQSGASALMTYRHTPFATPYRSHLLAARGILVLSAPLPNHAVVIDAAHQEQRRDTYEFASEIGVPRGFRSRYHDRLSRAGISYHMPLLYPDLAIGPLVYSRRLQGAVFADAGRGSDRTDSSVTNYRSIGAELTTDLAFFGTRSTTRLGVRLSQRLTGDKRAVAQFIVQLPQ